MKLLRNLLDKIEPHFLKGGKLEKLYPLYEANDTLIYSPGHVSGGGTHVRDSLDTKRMMTMVIVALLPCVFMALYNTGYQANKVIEQAYTQTDGQVVESLTGWRYMVMDAVGVDYTQAGDFYKNFTGFDIGRILQCMFHGALFFLPMYIITLIVGGHCEVLFSVIRKHEINEGFLVTSMLFPLTLPPDTPLWQVAVGIAFGVIVGKEIFGGTGTNFLNPALTARAFLYFSYAPQMSGDKVWTAVDGFSGATALGALASDTTGGSVGEIVAGIGGKANGTDIAVGTSNYWWDAFWGNIHGSIGETSTFCCDPRSDHFDCHSRRLVANHGRRDAGNDFLQRIPLHAWCRECRLQHHAAVALGTRRLCIRNRLHGNRPRLCVNDAERQVGLWFPNRSPSL